jgi:hypothetical protein
MVMRFLAAICFLPVFSIAHGQQIYPIRERFNGKHAQGNKVVE